MTVTTATTIATSSVADLCQSARRAARELAQVDTAHKDAALTTMARALLERTDEILQANARDMESGREVGLSDALLDRLALDEMRIEGIARAVERIVALPDPVGEVIEGRRLPNGLDVCKVRVPLGVVAVIYEARPNVTIDATALCVKSGNAIVLRGSSSAAHSNAALALIAAEAMVGAGLPEGCIGLIGGPTHPGGREELAELATQEQTVDLIIPRGGEGLKAALGEVATVPVIYAASGNCHIYVDAAADLDQAQAIVMNAKVQRPGVCNAAETLLVHEAVAEAFLPRIVAALSAAGVSVRADARACEIAAGAQAADTQATNGAPSSSNGALRSRSSSSPSSSSLPPLSPMLLPATEEDWATEYLALTLAIGVVGSREEAIEHIGRYGSGHSEAIVTRDTVAARAFQLGVDSACVYVNASTRFTDGGEFGMGAEIGNSTQKLHARGPIGLRELCTFKYLVTGDGHIRG
jgi:glutamate-5-semialdehyde dehydrogenase